MKSTDKFLVGIVVGIILLVIAAFVVTLARPDPTYRAGDAPADVAHNYLLALQNKDLERAYAYLSPTLDGYPDSVEAFAEGIEDHSWRFRTDLDITLAVESAEATGSRAVVDVREARFSSGDLFDSSQRTTIFEIELQLEDGEWKIVDADYYFSPCWVDSEGWRCD